MLGEHQRVASPWRDQCGVYSALIQAAQLDGVAPEALTNVLVKPYDTTADVPQQGAVVSYIADTSGYTAASGISANYTTYVAETVIANLAAIASDPSTISPPFTPCQAPASSRAHRSHARLQWS